jgi:S1-C subfamily serine protease
MRRGAALVGAAIAAAGCGGAAGGGAPAPLRVTVATGALQPDVATGFAVGGGRVVTVAHVLHGGGAVRVAGRPARVVRADRRLDLAVLAVPGLRTPRAVGRGARVEVLRAGRPRALPARVEQHVTATLGHAVRPALEVSAAVEPGDSGAPVTDGAGRVVGVVFARSGAGTAWAVDAVALRRLLLAAGRDRRTAGL